MSRKRHKPEEIVAKLRQVGVLVTQGAPVANAIRSISVTEVAARRASRWRDLRQLAGGSDHPRELEAARQHGPAARLAGPQATCARGVRARLRRLAGCAHPTGSAGQAHARTKTNPQLTFTPDHPRGADHVSIDDLEMTNWTRTMNHIRGKFSDRNSGHF